jgi:hypothetical protein
MEHINWKEIAAALLVIWLFIKKWYAAIAKIVEPLCEEAEILAQDHTIDREDRKKLVMKAIVLLEKQGSIKLNFLNRLIIGHVVNRVASSLPDIDVSENAVTILEKARE